MQNPYHQDQDDDASTLGSKSLDDREDRSITGSNNHALPRIITAGDEMESLCRSEMSGGNVANLGFPPTCLPIVRLLSGNHCCVDCGDEEMINLKYASVGYGTVLCQDCAHRHVTMSGEESNVKSLKEDHWNLRSTLAILEGSNTHMLDYVKQKPRWQPPKNASENYSEDVLAFKQIYLSKAAGSYRKKMAKKVDDVFYKSISGMREEDAAREVRVQKLAARANSITSRDPFRHIFEQNNVAADEIPGFFSDNGGKAAYRTTTASPRNSDPDLSRDNGDNVGARHRMSATKSMLSGGTRRPRSSLSTSLMKHESLPADMIQKRIDARRNMNASIAMKQRRSSSQTLGTLGTLGVLEENDDGNDATKNDNNDQEKEPLIAKDAVAIVNQPRLMKNIKPMAITRGYIPARNTRRTGQDQLVGEVGNASFIDRYVDEASIGDGSLRKMAMQAMYQAPPEDDKTMVSRSSRVTKGPSLGTYRRFSTAEANGAVQQQQMVPRRSSNAGRGAESRLVAQQKAMATRAASSGTSRRFSSGEVNRAGRQQMVPRRASNSGRGAESRLVAQQGTGFRPSKKYLESLNKHI